MDILWARTDVGTDSATVDFDGLQTGSKFYSKAVVIELQMGLWQEGSFLPRFF